MRACADRCPRRSSRRAPDPARCRCCVGRWWSWSVRVALGCVRRPPRPDRTAPADRALAVARRGGRLPRGPRRRCRTPDPSRRRSSRTPSEVRTRHRRRLRRGDGPRPDPLLPPRPGPDRQAVRRATSAAPRGADLHPGVHRHAGPLDARGGAGPRDGGTGASRWSRSASPSSRIERRAAPTALAPIALGAALGPRRRPGRRLADQPRGCGGRPTAWARREITRMYEYYDAVLHAVREGLLLRRRPTAGCSWSTTRPRRLLGPARRRGRALARTTSGCRRRWSRRAARRTDRGPTRST